MAIINDTQRRCLDLAEKLYEKGEVVRVYYGLTATAKIVYTVLILLIPAAIFVYGTVRCVRRRYR